MPGQGKREPKFSNYPAWFFLPAYAYNDVGVIRDYGLQPDDVRA
jgi:hypothetical protein